MVLRPLWRALLRQLLHPSRLPFWRAGLELKGYRQTGRVSVFVLLCVCCFLHDLFLFLVFRWWCCLCYLWFLCLSVGLSHRPVSFLWVQDTRSRNLEAWFGGRGVVPPLGAEVSRLIAAFLTPAEPVTP